ncbi:MAG: PQQ-binding-like beta-propeller repeat protein [Verrucomicrobiota bacterium]
MFDSIRRVLRNTIWLAIPAAAVADNVHEGNWLHWRGPLQTGVSLEKYSDGAKFNPTPVWTADLEGRGTPVIHDGQLYSWTYRGKGPDLYEVLTAHNAETGEVLWERKFHDRISDTVYDRYTVGAATVDPETGHIYLHTTYGLFFCFDRDGNSVWEHSLMDRFGRLTFPNGRAGAPIIEGDMVITRAVTSYWGAEGPARDRFFAYDKATGEPIWSSTTGVGAPFLKDTSFSHMYIETRDGRRVGYVGLGCGNVGCINIADGKPLWRFQFSVGGVNTSPVRYGDNALIAIHGKENLDTTETGRMISLQLPEDFANTGGEIDPAQKGAPKLPESTEMWRNGLKMFTSSPTLVGDTIYQMTHEGELFSVNAKTGEEKWHLKLSNSQLHASPLYVNGLLIIPMGGGGIYVVEPGESEGKILHEIETQGGCLGSPAVANGMVYVQSMGKLYAFKFETESIAYDPLPEQAEVEVGEAVAFRAVPSDVLLEPGDRAQFKLYEVDANGNVVGDLNPGEVSWESFVPPTARVKARMDAAFESGELVAGAEAKVSAGMFKGTSKSGLSGFARGRVIESIPFSEDFEGYELTVEHATDGVNFAFPPLPWIGARLKWEVRELDGNKVLAKTLDRILFQRCMSFIGHPDSNNYTMQADVMTDGNRRVKSTIGLINQNYIISLIGNTNKIEISSNHERVKVDAPFPVTAGKWYTLKARVDTNDDGSGVIRGKAWEKGTDEPDEWNIEFTHRDCHKKGAPGLFGFSPQSQKRVFVDNISVTPND